MIILRPTFERLARLFLDEQTITQTGAKKIELEPPDSQIVPLHVVSKLGKIETMLDYGQKLSPNSLDNVSVPSDLTFESLARSFTKRSQGSRGSIARGAMKSVSSQNPGRYVWYEPARETPWDVAISPTIRNAALHSGLRRKQGVAVEILPEDVQVKVKEYRSPLSIVILLDMSESMISSLDNVARAILSLHKSAYRRREQSRTHRLQRIQSSRPAKTNHQPESCNKQTVQCRSKQLHATSRWLEQGTRDTHGTGTSKPRPGPSLDRNHRWNSKHPTGRTDLAQKSQDLPELSSGRCDRPRSKTGKRKCQNSCHKHRS